LLLSLTVIPLTVHIKRRNLEDQENKHPLGYCVEMGASRLQTLDIPGHCLLFYFHLQPGGGQLGQMLRSLFTNQVRALGISTNRRTGSPAVLFPSTTWWRSAWTDATQSTHQSGEGIERFHQ
jgi:hypothetical protein